MSKVYTAWHIYISSIFELRNCFTWYRLWSYILYKLQLDFAFLGVYLTLFRLIRMHLMRFWEKDAYNFLSIFLSDGLGSRQYADCNVNYDHGKWKGKLVNSRFPNEVDALVVTPRMYLRHFETFTTVRV